MKDIKTDCDPIYQVSNLWENQKYSYNKLKTFKTAAAKLNIKPDLVDTDPATPCGLIAKSLFNDTYQLWYAENKDDFAAERSVSQVTWISNDKIAWSSDVEYKFKNTDKMDKQWWDMTDQHFIVWMRTAGLPNFRKLWGRVEAN